MSPKSKFHLTFSLVTLVVASVFSWLLVAETSPFSVSFEDSVLLNLWRGLHLFPALAAWSGGEHAGNDLVFLTTFAVQWLLIGLVLSFVVWRFRAGPSETPHILQLNLLR